MQRQYAAIKEQYPDVLVMFRMGDFYEMFDEDAEKAAPILEIVLTRRDGRPMCGVPYHALERYMARLLAAGMRVAVCDQVEDPKKAKGLVRREVTRVVSAGTVLEDSFLPASANNFLAALAPGASSTGVAVADVSTGEFLVTQFAGERHLGEALAEIERLRPAECVISERDEDLAEPLRAAGCRLVTPVSRNGAFATGPRQTLLEHFGVASLLGFGCEDLEQAQEAAALILTYLRASNPGALAHLRSLSTYSAERYMQLDAATRRNLELTVSQSEDQQATLLRVVDCTRTPMGARMLRRWLEQPLLDLDAIRERQGGVKALVEDVLLRGDVRDLLAGVQDVERIVARASSGVAGPRDLLALARSLEKTANLAGVASRAESPLIRELAERCRPPEGGAEEILAAIDESAPLHVRDGGVIRAGYSSELDTLRDVAHGGREWIARIESEERERTGIKSLKVGYNSVFGYYIEVSKANTALVPDHYIRKQTTTNAERYITPELKEQEATVLGAQERAVALEQELFAQVRGAVAARAQELLGVARAVAELDAL
ncbi:MAG: DNA mismatch repair protein MutS, partial [Armatimonadota bacterium]